MPHKVAVVAALLLLASACARDGQLDHLARARRSLQPAPCGAAPAVAGLASVNEDPRQVYLGDWVVVSVCHMQTLMKDAEARQQPVTLFIEGIDSGNAPVGVDYDSGTLTFVLDRNDKNKALWKPLLYNPLFDPAVTMHLSVGIPGERPLPRAERANATAQLRKIYFDWSTAIWLGVLLVLIGALFTWSRNTDMLRDGPPVDGVRQPYSLARTQMAWWLFLILVGFNYVWLITGDRDSVPPSLLGLMGISAATAIASVAIPTGRKAVASRSFWRDLVTDERGVVALDRVQILLWTVILGGIFLYSVVWDLTMPEFNATMLALMGISSGTYLGFKLPTKSEEPDRKSSLS